MIFASEFVGASHRFDQSKAERLYNKGQTDKQIAVMCAVSGETVRRWRIRNNLKENNAPERNTAQCKGCIYWRSLAGATESGRACHHLLDTDKRRIDEDGVCKSREAG